MLPKKELGASFLTYPNLKQVSQKDESEYSLLALMGIVTMFLGSNWETKSMAIDSEAILLWDHHAEDPSIGEH